MEIIIDYPPMFDMIDAKFKVKNKPVIYAWGNTIYNPLAIEIPPQIIGHEQTHGSRQRDDPKGWWFEYLNDDFFRFNEELFAHREEYKKFRELNKDRNAQAKYLHYVAVRLSSPLYGSIVPFNEALKMIKEY